MLNAPASSAKTFQWLMYFTVGILVVLALINTIAGMSLYEENKDWIWLVSYDPVNLYLYVLGLYRLFNWIDILFIIMLAAGAVLFYRRQSDDSGLLRFGLGIICIQSIGTIFHAFGYKVWLNSMIASGEISRSQVADFNPWLTWLPVMFDVISVVVTLFLVRTLDKAITTPGIDQQDESSQRQSWFIVSSNTRLVHYLVDSAIIFMALFPLVKGVMMMMGKAGIREEFNRTEIAMMYVGGMLIYYSFFELLFKTTPAKWLSGTYVIESENMRLAQNNRIYGRIVARFIPFEALSFFGTKGWHDSASKTTVARPMPTTFRYGWNMIWFVAFLFILALPPILAKLEKERSEREESKLRSESMEADLQLRKKYFGKGYLLNVQNKSDYSERLLLHASDQRGDSVEITVYERDRDGQTGVGRFSGWSPSARGPFMVSKYYLQAQHGSEIRFYHEALGKDGYEVEQIEVAGFPLVTAGYASGTRTRDGIIENRRSIRVSGQSCTITSLETVAGDADWQNELPQFVKVDSVYNTGSFELIYRSKRKEKPVTALMKVESPDGTSYIYKLTMEGRHVGVELQDL